MTLLISMCIYSIPVLIIQFVWLTNIESMNYIVPIVTFIAIVSCALNYIFNPGIIYSYDKYKEKVYCSCCKMLYPKTSKKIIHCNICQICIQGHDHHCGVIGKCVGKINMIIFIILYLSGMAFIICSVFVIIYLIK